MVCYAVQSKSEVSTVEQESKGGRAAVGPERKELKGERGHTCVFLTGRVDS